MIKNYFKIAWRNLVKNKKSSLINIGGLSIGMAVAMLIGLWIWDELNFDKYHKNYDRVAQVFQHQTWNGEVGTGPAIPMPLGEELRTSYGSNFKYLAMASWEGEHILTLGDKHINTGGMYIEKDGPKILSLKMVAGTLDGLSGLNSILISAATAKSLFGTDNAMGKNIKIDSKLDVTITGVYEDLPFNTSMREVNFIAPWDLYITTEEWFKRAATQWGNNSFQLYAEIGDNTSFEKVNRNIINAKFDKLPEEEKKYKARIFLHPMKDWRLRSSFKGGFNVGGQIQYVKMIALIGVFVLLLACINFMNLSTARSERRAKEVGIRKTVGSHRGQLVAQFLSEAVLVALIAFIFSLLLTQLCLPWFNEVSDKKMSVLWGSPVFWMIGIAFSVITGIIAGSYPALYLSSFNAIKVLKGSFKTGRFSALPRKILVVIQFSVSIALIIGTIIVYQQIQHTKNRPVGYNREGLLMINMQTPEFYGKHDILEHELKKINVITEIAETNSPLNAVWSNTSGFNWEGKDPNLDDDFATIWVSQDYGKTVGMTMVQGRDFSKDFPGDTASLIINEAALKFMNLKDPVGKQVTWNGGNTKLTIVGVAKDMIMSSPYEPVKQAVYLMNPNNVNWILLKLNPSKSISESLAGIESVFKKIIPSAPFKYEFIDKAYASKFDDEVRVGKLAGFFTILAIIISCLGLFGLASFVAEQRTKEIGIRKIVGASVFNLWKLLSKDFIFLVSLSCLIAMPLGYYFLNKWLQNYQYKIAISWWVFAAAFAGAIIITLLTVSFQAIKAALANPVKSLRTE
jgi:ABC-type antimicrobial peptide transport system permease subunit